DRRLRRGVLGGAASVPAAGDRLRGVSRAGGDVGAQLRRRLGADPGVRAGPAAGRDRGAGRTPDRGRRRHPTRPYHGRVTTSEPSTTARVESVAAPAARPAGRKRVLLAKPRGYCAGVDRAVQTVEEALRLYGPPIYVRKQIVHNRHVVSTLEQRGAIFVEETDQVPEGSIVIFSAHGVAPE